ncbi:hypothetical protein COLSTE_02198 [Collinsella stercoris DSM 13279]|uniref:Uncharacterized protein n=1 Tax=Collinsella stercoris DSM 13279 TaxID=445975 RepID=B6GDL5_9ACTN|nr:hypothetical protein COLSTE_02198 [Collinsella stercoris DSM 13279]
MTAQLERPARTAFCPTFPCSGMRCPSAALAFQKWLDIWSISPLSIS